MTDKASRLRERLTIDPDDTSLLQQSTPTAVTTSTKPTTEKDQSAASRPKPDGNTVATTGGHTSHGDHTEGMETALDDPALLAGRKTYRSFYVDDLAFGRFRAAIYWLARRPDAAGKVPENMSAAINDAMINLATELENLFNNGNVFPPTPEQRKPKRVKQS